jgi:archaellum component FlaF (FlaF/FlaG flagellin family)
MKFRKNAKALSPVVASIILIAATIAVSVVVAAWMGGIIGPMGNAEQASITNVAYLNNTAVTVTVRNTGNSTVTINSAAIDYSPITFTGPANNAILEGGTQYFVLNNPAGAFSVTEQYTIELLTARGNTIASTYTYTGS